MIVGPTDGISALLSRLVDDAKAVLTSEVTLRKVRLKDRLVAYKTAIVLFAVAAILALAALFALLVGAILALATLIGPGFATLVVATGVLLLAAGLAWIGKARLEPPAVLGDVT